MKKYCWEFFHCNQYDCPVYRNKEYKCWLISGTHCRNEIQGNFLEKIEMCLPCEIFKANMEVTALDETLGLVNKQVQELKGRVEERDRELRDINLELAIGFSEVYEALKEISSGNPYVRIPETSDLELISKLKNIVNLTAVNIAEVIDLSHEFAIGLAEHFDVLHRVSKGDLTARVLGTSPVELLEFLKKVTNETIESVARGIDERLKAEGALRESEAKYRLIVNQIPQVVFRGYADWSVDFFDRKIEEVTGFSKEDFDSRQLKWINLIIPEDVDCVKNVFIEALKSTKSYVKEYRIQTRSGERRWIQLRGQIFCDVQGKIEYISGILVDITERKKAEAERRKLEAHLRQAQKMEAIGTLAGGIAHDFNNILTAIIGFVELAQIDLEQLPGSGEIRSNLAAALQASERAKDLVKQILTFSRQVDQELKPVQILPIVKEGLNLLRATLPATIDIRQHLDPRCRVILADPIQIHQILINLCTNAYHAMQDSGGVLAIRLETVAVDQDFARIHTEIDEGPYVRLTVGDTGSGMDHSTLERIFDPFFTTKTMGGGTGLGLSVVHGIVKSLGGALIVYSELGKGTSFQIYFPQYQEAVAQEAALIEPVPLGQENILFVDDEEQVSQIGQKLLERLGYKITATTSSLEALKIFRANPERFDLIVTDLTMPQMTGLELAKELLSLRPEIPIILTTGFSEAPMVEKARRIGIRECLMKPLLLRELGKSIRRVLDSSHQLFGGLTASDLN